jgi:hypothetical protein
MLIPYLNKGCSTPNSPIIAKTNNGKRNEITKNNINNLTFITQFLNYKKYKVNKMPMVNYRIIRVE